MNKKKGISPVVATALLIVVAVVAVIGFQNWFGMYSSGMFVKVEADSKEASNSQIETLIGDQLYFKNTFNENISIKQIKLGTRECNISMNISPGVHNISLNDCTDNLVLDSSVGDIMIITDKDIYTKKHLFKDVKAGSGVISYSSLNVNYNSAPNGNLYNLDQVLINVSSNETIQYCELNFNGTQNLTFIINGSNCWITQSITGFGDFYFNVTVVSINNGRNTTNTQLFSNLESVNWYGDESDGDILVNSTGIYQSFNDGISYSIVPGTTVNKWPCQEDGDMVVINAKNFIVESGGSIGPYNRTRGMVIYASKDIFVNGSITVSNRGAKANPDDTSVTSYTPNPSSDGNTVPTEGLVIRRIKTDWSDINTSIISNAHASSINDFNGTHNSSDLFFGSGLDIVNSEANQGNVTNGLVIKIPKIGALGGSGAGYTTPGNKLFASGGGGGSSNGRTGSTGTCFSGGSGGGSGQNGLPYGGKGGDHQSSGGVSQGGGAGNPGGSYYASGQPGSGTGGLLIIFARGDISLKQNALSAAGTSGGNCYGDYCGGGSGGGVIATFYAGNFINLDSSSLYGTYTYTYASLTTNYGSNGIFNTLGGRWGAPGGSLEGTTSYVGEYGGTGAIIGPIKIDP